MWNDLVMSSNEMFIFYFQIKEKSSISEGFSHWKFWKPFRITSVNAHPIRALITHKAAVN